MTAPRSRQVAFALAVAGAAGIVASVGWNGLPVAAGWLIVISAGIAGFAAMRPRAQRIAAAITLPLCLPVCVFFVWEGGLFFLPATFVLAWGELAPPLTRRSAHG